MKATGILMAMMGITLALTAFVAVNQSTPTESDATDRLAAVEKRLIAVEELLLEVRETGRSVKRRVDSAPRRLATVGAAPIPSGTPSGMPGMADDGQVAAFQDQVAARVESVLEKKMEQLAARARYRGADGKWKPPIAELTSSLGLDPDQERALRGIFNGARDEALALLNEERPDGGSLLTDFADDIAESGDAGGATKRFFGRMTKETVPGREQTYLNALFEVGERVQANVDAQLDEPERRAFRELNVDVFEVQTGHDPLGDFVKARLGFPQ